MSYMSMQGGRSNSSSEAGLSTTCNIARSRPVRHIISRHLPDMKLTGNYRQAYSEIRSSKMTKGSPWTRRKSMSLVMKRRHPVRIAVAA